MLFCAWMSLYLGAGCDYPLEGVNLRFKDPLTTSLVELRFSDASGKALINDLKITLGGTDRDKIVNSLNVPKFKVSLDGILLLAVSPDFTPSSMQPIRFSVLAESEMYQPHYIEVVMTSTAKQTYSVRLLAPQALPSHITIGQNTAKVFGGKLALPISLQTLSVPPKTSFAQLNIPENLGLLDLNRQPISGKVFINLRHFDALASSSGFFPTKATTSNSQTLQGGPFPTPFELNPIAAAASVRLFTDAFQEVRWLEKPISLTIALSPNVKHPKTGLPIKLGDEVPVYSYQTLQAPYWQEEPACMVTQDLATHHLVCVLKISHLSDWILGWPQEICGTGPSFSIQSLYPTIDLAFYSRLVEVGSNQILDSRYLNVSQGATASFGGLPKGKTVQLQLFDYAYIYGGHLNKPIATSAAIPLCSADRYSLDARSLPALTPVKIEGQVSCPTGQTFDDANLPAQIRVQFHPVGMTTWYELATIKRTDRSFTTYLLKDGQSYDFRGSTDGGATWPYKQTNYPIKREMFFKIEGNVEGFQFCK